MKGLKLMAGGAFLSILLLACKGNYIGTTDACDGRLFREIYETNPLGLYAVYLTDSANFRIRLGDFDPKQNGISCDCAGDSVIIQKRGHPNGDDYVKTYWKKIFSLTALKSQHNLH